MRGALAGNPVGVMEEARKTLMAAYQSAKPAGKKALQKFLDDPEAFTALPEQVIVRLAKGDASAVADAARFTSFPSRTAGQWVPPEGGIYSPEAIALGAGTAGAVGVGIAAGGANPKPSSPADLSDGLAGAPQDDITPEPVAGEAPPAQPQPVPQQPPAGPPQWDGEMSKEQVVDLLSQFDQSLPEDPRLRAEYESLYPQDKTPEGYAKRARYQAYINSLPQNSPEAMARKRKRWAKSDADMVDFANRLGLPGAAAQLQEFDRQAGLYPTQSSPSSERGYQSDLPPGLDPNHPRWGGDPARVQQLMDANPGAFFGPGELPPEQEQQKKRLEGNREQYYDQVNNAKTPEGKPVFQRAEGTYGGNEELGVEPYQKYEYTEDARQMREGENAASFMEGPISLKDRQLARRLLEFRADRVARQTGRNRTEVRNELMNSGSFYRDPASGRLMLRSGDDTRDFTRQQQIDDLDLRREKVRQRGEMGLLPSQSAISNTVVDARRILNDPSASSEMRLAAEYYLNPRKFMVDYARAQNPPRYDADQYNPLAQGQAMVMQQQLTNEAVTAGREAGQKGHGRNPNDKIGRERARDRVAKQYAGNATAQLAALAAFDEAWPEEGDPNRTPQGGPRGAGMPTLPSGAPLPGVM